MLIWGLEVYFLMLFELLNPLLPAELVQRVEVYYSRVCSRINCERCPYGPHLLGAPGINGILHTMERQIKKFYT